MQPYVVLFALCLIGLVNANAVITCDNHPCKNGGTCIQEIFDEGYRCKCPMEYYGTNCEKRNDKCDTNPCLNGGSCQVSGPSQSCVCPPDASGKMCQYRPCDTKPCGMGECFIVYENIYFCLCPDGHVYKDCNGHDVRKPSP
ncbi:delta-like protein B [Acanthaster planci]|uniref:Delta-like protein B n=1 Tax=Acanthaster planci TaxID=133434 RepID=A0A8B7ZAE0_ACAPL|nr:delta-like protein B [Acanthaster planci]